SGLPPDTYSVEFDPTCSGTQPSPYAIQFYNGASSVATATQLTVIAGQSLTAINASLSFGASISGSVTAAGTALAGVCASASARDGRCGQPVPPAPGTSRLSGLPPDTYTVEFDPTCSGTQPSPYAFQFYNGASSALSATPVSVAGNQSVTAI